MTINYPIIYGFSVFTLLALIYSPYDYLAYVVMMLSLFLNFLFKPAFFFKGPFVALFCFSVSILLSLIFSVDFQRSAIPSLYIILIIAFSIFSASRIDDEAGVEVFLFFGVLGFLLIGLRNFTVDPGFLVRSSGVAGQPNALGLLSGTGVVVSLALIVMREGGRSPKVFLCAFSGALSMYWLVMSGSRGAFLATGVSLVYLYCMCFRFNVIRYLFLALVVLFVSVLNISFFESSALFQRLMALPQALGMTGWGGGAQFESAADPIRIEIASKAYSAFFERPLLGNGTSTFINFSDYVYTHSTYLEVMFSLGLIGLVTFVLFLATSFGPKINGGSRFFPNESLAIVKNFSVMFFVFSGFSIPSYQSKSQIVIYIFILMAYRIVYLRHKEGNVGEQK